MTLCELLLVVNLMSLLTFAYLVYAFRRPLAIVLTMARSMLSPPPKAAGPSPQAAQEDKGAEDDEDLPPSDTTNVDTDGSVTQRRRKLSFDESVFGH